MSFWVNGFLSLVLSLENEVGGIGGGSGGFLIGVFVPVESEFELLDFSLILDIPGGMGGALFIGFGSGDGLVGIIC